jgi:hypothetical protein
MLFLELTSVRNFLVLKFFFINISKKFPCFNVFFLLTSVRNFLVLNAVCECFIKQIVLKYETQSGWGLGGNTKWTVNKKKHKKNAEITIIYLFFKVKHEK